MTKEEWATVAKFGALVLGISLIDARIAYIAVVAIGLMVVVTNGTQILNKYGPAKPASTPGR